ncbi:MAG TPA: tetratricopeptide repeat protein [Mariprofundaceae bacterium]|nr:tetratricopeptide repeat protein [Mariprofundaceae bacterium]
MFISSLVRFAALLVCLIAITPVRAWAGSGDINWSQSAEELMQAEQSPAKKAPPEPTSPHKLFLRGLDHYQNASTQKDYDKALKLWLKAAKMGDLDAQSSLGYLYHTGKGVTRNERTAAMWYHKAAQHGAADAQSNLGVMYYKGTGVPQNNVRAMVWLMRAKRNGFKRAEGMLNYIEGASSSDEIARAQKIATAQPKGQ